MSLILIPSYMDLSTLTASDLYKFYSSITASFNEGHSNYQCSSLRNCNSSNKNEICILCQKLKKILNEWEKYKENSDLSADMSCDYLNHWIYGKLKDTKAHPSDIDLFYKEWKNFTNGGDLCVNVPYNKLSTKELGNKKILFDFIEFYSDIKDIMNKGHKKNECCKYIKYIFKLFNVMKNKQNCKKYSIYLDELYFFKEKINNEMDFLKEKCPQYHLHLEIDKTIDNTIETLPYEQEIFQEKYNNSSQNISSHIVGEFPSEMSKYNNVLKELEAYKIYDEFNNKENLNISCSNCDRVSSFEFDYPGITDLCEKLYRNLKRISEITNEEKKYEKCGYLYYWIYGEVWRFFGKTPQNNIKNIVLNLIDVWYNSIYDLKLYECLYIEHPENGFRQWKEQKYLHDYFKNHESISKCTEKDVLECKIYCIYIANIIGLYKKHLNDCCVYFYDNEDSWENCDSYFNCNKKYNPYELLLKFGCDGQEHKEDMEKAYEETTIDKNVKLLSIKKPEKFKLNKIAEETHTNDELFGDPFNVVVLSFFSLIGMFLTFFLFYKFTPLKYRTYKKSIKKDKLMNDFHSQYAKKSLQNKSHHLPSVSRNNRVRISYYAGSMKS
ncbi:variable surface protein [Plasmodium gonderi]|uniref:Variable surface protein n=1 Tax=Plasmodium gonderi TaxID=77519 RepID=A0A1Y1JMH4_PLAGO|nr:variable surface protein [Plasmodium gonderi]GAW82042.1 variable surface protein [Plasmodium gonderi]